MAARKGPVVKAVEQDLKAMRAAATGALAASALALARELDAADTRPADIAACSRALRETLDRLRELAPPKQETDGIDDLTRRRERRRARRSAS
jgi:hypothetical protein